MSMNEERTIRYSNGCIKEIDLPYLLKKNTVKRKLISVEKTVNSDMLGDVVCKFLPFEIEHKTHIQHILVDAKTGSMYDKATGNCLSSTRLRIKNAG